MLFRSWRLDFLGIFSEVSLSRVRKYSQFKKSPALQDDEKRNYSDDDEVIDSNRFEKLGYCFSSMLLSFIVIINLLVSVGYRPFFALDMRNFCSVVRCDPAITISPVPVRRQELEYPKT